MNLEPAVEEPFPFRCPVDVRYADVDAMNHVNNAVYVSYLEVARMRLWQAHFGFDGAASDVPFIVARVAVDYRRPISLLDAVHVAVAVKAIGGSSFTLAYRVVANGRVAAEAETVQVHYDYAAGRPVPIPEQMRQRLAGLRGPFPASEQD